MKRLIITIVLTYIVFYGVYGQETKHIQARNVPTVSSNPSKTSNDSLIDKSQPQNTSIDSSMLRIKQKALLRLSEEAKEDSIRRKLPIYGWKVSSRLGERKFVDLDTTFINYHQSTITDGKDVAVSYLGNLGSASETKIFFNRPEASRFIFQDAFTYWRKKPEDQIFLNTKVPYSSIDYQESGNKRVSENRFSATLASNFGKKLNIGMDFDYIYARGFYNSLSNKGVSYDLNSSYIGDKYSMQFFFGFNSLYNRENGGITDSRYITSPNLDELRFSGNSVDIPTRLEDTWNKLRGRYFYLNHRYDLGNEEETVRLNDSTVVTRKKQDYIPPASIILTTYYNDQRRSITSDDQRMDSIFNPTTIFPNETIKYTGENINDYMSFYSLKNTLSLAMNEGFKKWVKFGLTAFIEYDIRKYSIPDKAPHMQIKDDENAFTIGGILSSEMGKHIRYRASIEKNFLAGDFALRGEFTTLFSINDKDVSAKAKAYIKDISPSYFQNHFSSKYWNWNYDFNDTRRYFVGGEINVPHTRTKISGGVENLQNYIYYNKNGIAAQKTGSVQVISLQLDQQLQAGIFHWDNKMVYQMTSDDDVIPLPDLSWYSNAYITGLVAKVLHYQLGVDGHFYTKYHVPGYNILTMQYYNQRDTKIGNFPIATVYLNLLLKNTRFFIMYYNAASSITNGDAFTVPYYPVNPAGIRLGLSWKFNN